MKIFLLIFSCYLLSSKVQQELGKVFPEELVKMVHKKEDDQNVVVPQQKQQEEKKSLVDEIENTIGDVIKPDTKDHSNFTKMLADKQNDGLFGSIFKTEDELQQEDVLEISPQESLDKLLKEFKVLNCQGDFKDRQKAKDYMEKELKMVAPEYCTAKLKDFIFANLDKVDYSARMLSDWMKINLYDPLGYKMYNQFTFPDVMNQFMDLSKNEQMIHSEMQIPNERDFKRMVEKTFETVANASADFENNKGQISNIVLDLLKKFHIFWNVHRQRKHMDSLHDKTLNVVTGVLDKYKQTSDAMKAITLHIINNIKNAYMRFQKAHTMLELIHKNSGEMIAMQILRRIKSNYEQIHLQNISYDQMVTEMAYILDMLNGFFLVNHKSKVNDQDNQQLFDTYIFAKIKDLYLNYYPHFKKIKGKVFYDFKDWTATLLLKMKHQKQIVFVVLGIDVVVNEPVFRVNSQVDKSNEIVIYYELKDKMMFVPEKCLDDLDIDLKRCVEGKMSNIIRQFYYKYNLFASVGGSNLLSYLREQKNKLVDFISRRKGFDNYQNFRNLFYAQLFLMMRSFSAKYRIRELVSINKLEEIVGDYINQKKNDTEITKINKKLLNELDQEFYDDCLNVKHIFSAKYPLYNNPKLLNQINGMLISGIIDFYKKRRAQFNQQSIRIVKTIINMIDSYFVKMKERNFQTQKTKITPSTQVMPFTQDHSTIVQNIIHEPSMNSLRTMPTYGGL